MKNEAMRRFILSSVFVLLMASAALAEDVALVFTRPGCPPCERLKSALADDPSLFAGYRVRQLDAGEDKVMAARHGVRSVPTVVIVRNGRQVAKRSGYESPDDLREWLDTQKRSRRWRR